MFVFVYGTLKRGGALHHYHMKGARFVAEDVVLNCTLYMLEWYPAVIHGGKENVSGEVYEISKAQLQKMDVVEGEGTLYKRELVTTARHKYTAWMYFYLQSVDDAQRIESGCFDVTARRNE